MIESIRLFSYLLGTKKKLIFLSSGGTVYGNQKIQPIKEDVMALPINHYGNVKLCIENTMRVFNTQMHSKMLIARISNPYGPGQDFNKGVGFIDAAIKKAMLGDVLEIWGNGDTVRDYIYIDDVFLRSINNTGKYRISEFKAETYDIPATLLQDKKQVRVKFVAKPNKQIGEIYEVRLIKQ